uniref:Tyr recombinase domain-containing protein n=1 Tax=Bracon brevicornis TaxID=1563983 RepID=A0A6V7IJE1_9HYME
MQTLALINLQNITKNEDGYEIKIADRIKTSKINKPQPNLIIPFFKEDITICPASAMETYIELTKEIRGKENKLLIAIKKPHKAVGTQTLSKWIKITLIDSGIDTKMFSAYSTQHASTSAAKRNIVTIDSILKTAGWTQKSKTFAKFYDRPIVGNKTMFACAVLNKTSQ